MQTRRSPETGAVALALCLAFAAAGCGSDDNDAVYEPTPMALHSIGKLASTASSATALNLDLQDRPASAELRHGAAGCFTAIGVTATTADGDEVSLAFGPRATFGMALTGMTVKRGGGTWQLVSGDAWLPLDTLEELGDGPATLDKLLIAPRGEVELQRLDTGSGHPIRVQLAGLDFGGDVTSELDAKGQCKPCNDATCKAPFPTWRLRDFQPESPRFNLEYDMNVYLDEPVVAILTQGW